MLGVTVRRWAAWAPGLEGTGDWEAWSRDPRPLGTDGQPDVRFLPPLLRRRASRLSRVMLRVAHACCPGDELGMLPAVFASRHGEAGATLDLLAALARGEPITAAAFSHSVHNAQVGLFSIAAGNRRMASAVAAGTDTVPCAFLEALAVLWRSRAPAVLLVTADEPLPPVLRPFEDEPRAVYGVGLVLEADVTGAGIRLGCAPPEPPGDGARWPAGVEVLRWILSGEDRVTLRTPRHTWTWARG